MENKLKVLMLSDHALSTSGVGCQSRFLIEGLIKKGRWTFRQFGAAIKHSNYDVVQVNPDFLIRPIDGFGDRNTLMQALITEKPDVLFIFTDPRFFTWLYEIEDEVRQVCPIVYWHVWDNLPFPDFNSPIYDSTDLINCHSHMTYSMIKDRYEEKANFIPHSLPEGLFHPLPDDEVKKYKKELLGLGEDSFVGFWVNRNARRKRPNDVLWAWKMFIDRVKAEGKNTEELCLLLHTDPLDQEGPNLLEASAALGIKDNVVFSKDRIEFEKMNILHNIGDFCINISYAEGFGLATLEAMNCGRPIIAAKTGGLTRQVVDHRDNSENGVALEIRCQSLVGSQNVPYIYEDYVDVKETSDAIYKIYSMTRDQRKALGEKARNYALSEFSHQKTIDEWDRTMFEAVQNFKNEKRKTWTIKEMTL